MQPQQREPSVSVRVVTPTSPAGGEGGGARRRRTCVRPTLVAVVSSDPATVIFPACVGVREREFTPRSSRGGGQGIGACTCEGEDRVRCFLCRTCARARSADRRYAAARPRAAGSIVPSREETRCVRYASRIPRCFSAPICRGPASRDDGGRKIVDRRRESPLGAGSPFRCGLARLRVGMLVTLTRRLDHARRERETSVAGPIKRRGGSTRPGAPAASRN